MVFGTSTSGGASWYVAYLTGSEELDKGKVPMQSLIFLVIETMAVRVTLKLNIS